MARHNGRFAYFSVRPDDLQRRLNVPASRLSEILCIRDQCRLSGNLMVHCERRKFILSDSKHVRSAIGQSVETCAFADWPLEIRWKGMLLPYRVFDRNQQRVTHTNITENKRLARVLSSIVVQQQTNPPQVAAVGQ